MNDNTKDFLRGLARSMDDLTLVSMLERNREVAAQHHRNAERMDEIVKIMEEVKRERRL